LEAGFSSRANRSLTKADVTIDGTPSEYFWLVCVSKVGGRVELVAVIIREMGLVI
jgi:hypothetical protein